MKNRRLEDPQAKNQGTTFSAFVHMKIKNEERIAV